MDHYIKMGLLGAWALFALAALVWWRRRHASKQYSYTERAQIILDAIRDGGDVGMIYWSKSERKFIRRVVTPEELEGYSLRGLDHTLGTVRVFRVTRIRLIERIPKGAPRRAPSRLKLVSVPMLVAVALGAIALGLLAVALIRSQGPQQLTGVVVPRIHAPGAAGVTPSPFPPAPRREPAPAPKVTGRTEPAEDDFLNEPPIPVKPVEAWYLVVETHPAYKVSQVANTLQTVLRYRLERALELEQSVKNLGRAVVWSGAKERAERYRQLLDGYDIQAVVERAGETTPKKDAAEPLP